MSATPIILPAPGEDASSAPADKSSSSSADEVASGADVSMNALLAATPPFAGLSDAIIEAVLENADFREYLAGQTVFSMGQYDGAEFFIVAKGEMRASLIDGETGAIIVETLSKGSIFGLDLTFNDDENDLFQRLTIAAHSDVAVIALDAAAFRALAGQRPSLMRNVANYFARELAARRFSSLSAEAAPEQRVFAELVKFVERSGANGDWRIPHMPKHRELAELADVEEHVAAAAIADIIQEGVAHRDYPGLVISDMTRLNELAG